MQSEYEEFAKLVTRFKGLQEHLARLADDIDEHCKNARPYSLVFYYDQEEPLTPSQKKKAEEYLSYHFHHIWADTWMHMVSDHLREIALINKKWKTGD